MRRGAETVYIKKFAAKVRRKREELGLTQEELAEKVNCHVNHIGRIERGQVDPSLSMLLRIATALEVSVKDLVP